MASRALTIWAVTASVVAVAAVGTLGYVLGQRSVPTAAPMLAAASAVNTDPTAAAVAAPPAYSVPEMFAGVPTQWRSNVGEMPAAYAALFDPQRRQVIVEHCRHPGYDPDDRDALAGVGNMCSPVLRAQIAELTDTLAIGRARDGQRIEVRIDASLQQSPPRLRLRFDHHDADLQPGSKNDLVQALESIPAIAQQKNLYMQAQMTRLVPGQRVEQP